MREVLDLCLMCKACKSECPSNVDLAKLKAEWLSLYYRDRQRPIGHWLMGNIHRVNRLGAWSPGLVNRMQQGGLFRWLLEKVAGIDRRRSLPVLHEETLRLWMARRRPRERAPADVLLLDDCFTNSNEPHVGQAAVEVLEAAGCRVRLAGLTCCGRALISKGYLAEVRQLIQTQAPRLAAQVVAGLPILGLEPSCLLTLCDEWPELVPGPTTQAIARAAHLADAWLARELDAGRRTLTLRGLPEQCVVHGHCHQKALVGMEGTAALLRRIPELEVRVLDTGCCGMAGSFGYEKAHYDISTAIARLDLLPALEKDPQALVVAPGTSCRHQIKDLTPRRAAAPAGGGGESAIDSAGLGHVDRQAADDRAHQRVHNRERLGTFRFELQAGERIHAVTGRRERVVGGQRAAADRIRGVDLPFAKTVFQLFVVGVLAYTTPEDPWSSTLGQLNPCRRSGFLMSNGAKFGGRWSHRVPSLASVRSRFIW